MTEETRQDVFDALYDEALSSAAVPDSYLVGSQEDWLNRYDSALPDELVTIPQAVGSAIRDVKATGNDLPWAFAECQTRWRDFAIKEARWVLQHPDTFAAAWLAGVWRVAETGEVERV